MDTINGGASFGASVFQTAAQDPKTAIVYALSEVEDLLARYLLSGDVQDRMALLTEVEGLRRYVLVRGALVAGLRKAARSDGSTLGFLLRETLQAMIGDAPKQTRSTSLQGARNVERDTRRAVASLAFLASLNPSFV